MNIKALHNIDKSVSAIALFKGGEGRLTAIQILGKQLLKEHITKTPALLICVEGEVVFNNEHGKTETLMPGDYVNIEPMVKHWVAATVDSNLLLLK